MKTTRVSFTQVFTDLEEAVKASNEAYGLTAFDKRELPRKISLHKKAGVKKYYLDETGAVWYKVNDHVNKFSWFGCLHNGRAAIVIKLTDRGMVITEHVYNREHLRSRRVWTLDTPAKGTVIFK